MAAKKYTKEDIEWLKKHYKKDKVQFCADHFGVSKNAIINVASRRGIQCGRYLTKEQIEYFELHQEKSNQYLAKKFGFTEDAIRMSRSHYGFDNLADADEESLICAEIARMVGKQSGTINKTWCKNGLQFQIVGKRYKKIKIKDLYKWMQENPDRWDATQCEEWFFRNQKWFQEKLKADSFEKRKARWGEFYEVV